MKDSPTALLTTLTADFLDVLAGFGPAPAIRTVEDGFEEEDKLLKP
jgi:hypothetical protein